MAMLNDLLNNTLDPGYRLAATKPRRRRWWDGPLVWLGCIAAGLLLVVAYQQNHRSEPARDKARQDLITRIHSLQRNGDEMEARTKQLAQDVSTLRDAQLGGESTSMRDLEIAAGAVSVTGPGVTVTLGEPTVQATAGNARPGAVGRPTAAINDKDIRSVVNQLWAGGAEAVAVNGHRLTPTSFIRIAGQSVLVDFQPISSPYTVDAIGDSDRLLVSFADSPTASRLKTMESVEGISFHFDAEKHVTLQSVTVPQPLYAEGPSSQVTNPIQSPQPASPSTEHHR